MKKILPITFAIIALLHCKGIENKEISLLGDRLFSISGSEDEGIYYKQMCDFSLDHAGKAYITNYRSYGVDVYSAEGKYTNTIGKKGDGPGELGTPATVFCGNDEMLVIAEFGGGLKKFSKDGVFEKSVKTSEIGIDGIVAEMCFHEEKIVVYYIFKEDYWIEILDQDLKPERRFATKVKNRMNPFIMYSDMEIDGSGRIYVTDNYDYKIYVYDLLGNNVKNFEKNEKKEEFTKEDFRIYYDHKFEIGRPYARLKNSSKRDRCWPCICGINLDKNRIFVWRTDIGENREFKVDVYDENMGFLCEVTGMNRFSRSNSRIRDGKFYSLDMTEKFPKEIERRVGRLGIGGIPDRLSVYQVPEQLYGAR